MLYLIQSHEMDINRVSISSLTDQFVAYVRLMQELNFDTASEFLVMAATLLHWKSKALLPQEDKAGELNADEELGMTQEELIRQLLEHQRFLAAGKDLSQLPLLGDDVFTRPNRRPPVEQDLEGNGHLEPCSELSGHSGQSPQAHDHSQERNRLDHRQNHGVQRPPQAQQTDGSQRSAFAAGRRSPRVVVTFLASLELSRLRKMRLHQEGTYQAILLELLETLRGFDLNLARGFDNPIAQAEAQVQAANEETKQAEETAAIPAELLTAPAEQAMTENTV